MRLATRLGLGLRAGLAACAFVWGAFGAAGSATAQIGSERYAAIVLDARSGNVLMAANPDETRHPASLTKMMTLYMVFEALRDGRLGLDSRIPISEEAAARPPSKLGVPAGHSISVEQAILALVTRSANDVAAAVGEKLGGSEARFAQIMTLRARALGMSHADVIRAFFAVQQKTLALATARLLSFGSEAINPLLQPAGTATAEATGSSPVAAHRREPGSR